MRPVHALRGVKNRSMRLVRRLARRRLPARGDYRETWSRLAQTERSAALHVAGDKTSEEFAASGAEIAAALDSTVGLRSDDVVLEIGCGIGRVGAVVAPRVKEWIGCDVAPEMLRYAQKRLEGQSGVRLVQISGWDLGTIPAESVDVVYCTVVFMHLDEWDRYQYVVEAMRVLRPAGRLYVDNFNLLSDEGWRIFEIHRATFHPSERPPHISKSSTPQELRTYLERAGFEEVTIEESGPWVRAFGKVPD